MGMLEPIKGVRRLSGGRRSVAQQYGCDRRQQEADHPCEENRRPDRIQPIDGKPQEFA
jgi:hypothetical protein